MARARHAQPFFALQAATRETALQLFQGGRLQGRWPVAVSLPPWTPHANRVCEFVRHRIQGHRRKRRRDSVEMATSKGRTARILRRGSESNPFTGGANGAILRKIVMSHPRISTFDTPRAAAPHLACRLGAEEGRLPTKQLQTVKDCIFFFE
jgi:hypothetical protein